MAISKIRKAALFLMSLDPPTAAELLRSANPEMLAEITAEMSMLDEQGAAPDRDSEETLKEFFLMLFGRETAAKGASFAKAMLQLVLGEDQSQQMFSLVQKRLEARDPFQRIRKAPVPALAEALKGESSQVMAIVLSELPPSGSSQLISKLDETIRPEVLRCMTSSREVSIEAKQRVASMIERNLAAQTTSQEEGGGSVPDKKLRKVAVLLRGMEVEAREPLLKGLEEQDADKHKAILELMILWEDISIVSDRSLQEALRSVSSASLALSLIGADAAVTEKIQKNISERAKAAIEEEASLLSSPSPNEVEQARQEILQTLRDMSIRGELQFVQE